MIVVFFWLFLGGVLHSVRESVHTCQPPLSQTPLLPSEEGGTKGGPGESPVCGQQGRGRVAGKVRNRSGAIRNVGCPFPLTWWLHTFFNRYWQTREQRAPTTTKAKPQSKARAEDQEQQDPMEFLQSDEEEEDKGSQAGGAAKRRLQEQRERLHGALALIELANNLSA